MSPRRTFTGTGAHCYQRDNVPDSEAWRAAEPIGARSAIIGFTTWLPPWHSRRVDSAEADRDAEIGE